MINQLKTSGDDLAGLHLIKLSKRLNKWADQEWIYVREPCPAVWELGLYTQQTVTASLGGIGFLRQVLSCNFRKNYAGCVTVLKNRIWHRDSSHINLLVLKHKEMLINVFWKFYFSVQTAEANGMVRQIHSTVCALSFFPHFSLPVT